MCSDDLSCFRLATEVLSHDDSSLLDGSCRNHLRFLFAWALHSGHTAGVLYHDSYFLDVPRHRIASRNEGRSILPANVPNRLA